MSQFWQKCNPFITRIFSQTPPSVPKFLKMNADKYFHVSKFAGSDFHLMHEFAYFIILNLVRYTLFLGGKTKSWIFFFFFVSFQAICWSRPKHHATLVFPSPFHSFLLPLLNSSNHFSWKSSQKILARFKIFCFYCSDVSLISFVGKLFDS